MKCHQCSGLAMFSVGPQNQYPLCLHCSTKLKQADTDRLKTLQRIAEYNDQLLGYTIGIDSLSKPTPITDSNHLTLNNINVSNSNIGMINTGKISAETIDLAIGSLKENHQEAATALKNMTEAVLNNQEIDNISKEKLLEMLSLLAEESTKPSGYRRKFFIADIFEKITQCASLISGIKVIWDNCQPILKHFFN